MRLIKYTSRNHWINLWLFIIAGVINTTAHAQRPSLNNLQVQIDALKVLTPISSLPFTISQSGSYYLSQNVVASAGSGNRGIDINANNVTLDLTGFTLDCNGVNDSGIEAGTSASIVIRNGFINNCAIDGVSASGSDVVVENVHVVNNAAHGVILGGSGAQVLNVIARNNGADGIEVGNMATVNHCRVMNSGGDGIKANQYAIVTNNIVLGSQEDGISTNLVSVVSGNVTSTNETGLRVGAGSTLLGNASHQNSGWGVVSNTSSVIKNNMAYLNNTSNTGAGGININGNSLVKDNNASFNLRTGISVTGTGSTIQANHVSDSNENCYNFSSNDNAAFENTATDCITLFGGSVPPATRFDSNVAW